MHAVTQAETRNERTELQREISLWRSEAKYLHREYRKALAEFHRLEAALRQREQALEAYAAALEDQEERLAGEEWREPAERATAGAPVGAHEILKHWRLREDHERVKSRHFATLAYWSLLLQAVSGPGEEAHPPAGAKVPSRFHG
jgi:hypothetical protein